MSLFISNMQVLRKLAFTNIHKTLKFTARCDNILLCNSNNYVDKNITSLCVNNVFNRHYCEEPRDRKFPILMEFPNIVWPSVIKSFKNWILTFLIIVPRIDKDFHIKTFNEGSKKAVQMITQAMSTGDMDTLKELVTPEAFNELRVSLNNLTLTQKSELSINHDDDIYFQFPYEIGIIIPDDNSKRCVEITMVYHMFKDFTAYKDSMDDSNRIKISANPPYKDKLYVLNYRFIREYFPSGEDSGWIVNIVNHFKMEDMLDKP